MFECPLLLDKNLWSVRMDIKFVAGFAPIVTNLEDSRKFYGELLSVPIEY